ncbi:MAG: flagellar basal-body rod protein FlgG [Candidatus Margulisiibacteriota bacterium]
MFQPLYVAATGLNAFQDDILSLTNNLANAQTTGFKKSRSEMESLFYIPKSFKDELAGALQSLDEVPAVSPEFGTGVRVVATPKDFSQGSLQSSSNALDLAIQGSGFFKVKMPDGTLAYTRAGNFHADNEGNLVDANGHILSDSIVFPSGVSNVVIQQDGTVLVTVGSDLTYTSIGQISLSKFGNPSGLKSLGQNLFTETEASGAEISGNAADENFGTINQYNLEASNVDVISEMMRMVVIQRVFDTLTKAVNSYEGMLTSLSQMKS